MQNTHLSIMVVDDAKFSSAVIGRELNNAGYQDVRFASSAKEAIGLLEKRPASVLLADWLMPDVNGLQLTEQVRQLDETTEHYTYVILLTGREGDNVLGEAFEHGVDDFINKAVMHEQLLPRIYAADRLCHTLQRLLQSNRLLARNVANLEQRNLVEPVTGLGNLRYLQQRLSDSLRQIESRGGAMCYLLIGLKDIPALQNQHGPGFQEELLHCVARRLQQLVRPMDTLVCIDDHHFGLLTVLENLSECSPSSFKRLHDGLNLKAFKTSEGFVSLKAGIALVGMDKKALPQKVDDLLQLAEKILPDSYDSGRVTALRLPLPA
ncbi:response regulator receiver modulated diguanylate cyclase [Pseudomonas pohangensis]|jgi:PleD family two-component response regulator|uniref:Response regulator receiver modulated diguanylate cyclase n=1 Tax=Pseudomonas pohangensis TaxID=364197 RepID=A0A1H2EBT9_9PSED|nr:response regulator [Pseudomonas pohangensis]SDT92595.1 response regulator receiver modulated diguanylate cyclase [Pseudomonas pohangensis]